MYQWECTRDRVAIHRCNSHRRRRRVDLMPLPWLTECPRCDSYPVLLAIGAAGSTCRMPRGRPDFTHSAYSPAAIRTAAAMETMGSPRATLIASVKLTAAAPTKLIAREPNRLSCHE